MQKSSEFDEREINVASTDLASFIPPFRQSRVNHRWMFVKYARVWEILIVARGRVKSRQHQMLDERCFIGQLPSTDCVVTVRIR